MKLRKAKTPKYTIIIKMLVVYSLLMGATALSLMFKYCFQSDAGRMFGRVLTYLIMASIAFGFYERKKQISADFGYSTKNVGVQLLFSVIGSMITLSIFVFIPLLAGSSSEMILSSKQTGLFNILTQVLFLLLLVGPIEEFIFRGYFQVQLEKVLHSPIAACVISSLLFGFWHFPSTQSLINVMCAFVIGLIYSVLKTKFRHCTMVSVSLAHGLHDAVIFLMSCALL